MTALQALQEAKRISEPISRLRAAMMARAATGSLSMVTAHIDGVCWETPELRRLCFARWLYLANRISEEIEGSDDV